MVGQIASSVDPFSLWVNRIIKLPSIMIATMGWFRSRATNYQSLEICRSRLHWHLYATQWFKITQISLIFVQLTNEQATSSFFSLTSIELKWDILGNLKTLCHWKVYDLIPRIYPISRLAENHNNRRKNAIENWRLRLGAANQGFLCHLLWALEFGTKLRLIHDHKIDTYGALIMIYDVEYTFLLNQAVKMS